MASKKAQQIGIWIIAIAMALGTVASFLSIILTNENQQSQQANAEADSQKLMEEAQRERLENAEAIEQLTIEEFDPDSVTELETIVIDEGDGQVVESTDTIKASYTGWLSDGTIFDSTKMKDTDDEPIEFGLAQVISGWTEGLAGQKVGSTVKLQIPAAQGYGSNANGVIPANSPLYFYVKIHEVVTNE
ncbi:hypothetical protein B7Y92_03980 [Candidatus Saccharibacteria bacterium 32-50-13]|nr:MAG: hypothetical protein B7Y92_03980 [Candidatus Saccharibacteria bacterium 32-50-13]